ncbi:MAG: DUF1349 domain-containing protein [Bacteroidota bacterium]
MHYLLFLLIVLSLACGNIDSESMDNKPTTLSDLPPNLLAGLTPDNLQAWSWLNPPEKVEYGDGQIWVHAASKTDYFNDPETGNINGNAPLFYQEVRGDFIATAQVEPDFANVWNAVALMMYQDSLNWIKFAFENSDATGPGVVSVVTREVSDDANGPVLENQPNLWLRLIRKGDLYAMHWSSDGHEYYMARLSKMPPMETVKIGIESQCPIGVGARHRLQYFSLEQRTVDDLRKGV